MKTYSLCHILLLATLLLVACGGGDEEPNLPSSPQITIPSGAEDYFSKGMNFESEAGEKNLLFNATSDWTLSVSTTRNGDNWCTIFPTSGKSGENTVKVQVDANSEPEDRRITLTLTSGTTKKTIVVSQKQKDALTVTSDKFEVGAEGACIEVEVKANVDYEVVIPESSKSWISRTSEARGLTPSKLYFNIAKSEEKVKREGEILIKSGLLYETIHIYQTGQKIVMLTTNEQVVSSEGETVKVELKSNVDFGVKLPNVDWLTEEQGSRGISSHTLFYRVLANEGYDNRDASLIFFDKEDEEIADTLHLIQLQKNALIVGQKEYDVPSEGQHISVQLRTNVDYAVQTDCDWIEQTESRGLNDHELTFNIKSNPSKHDRTGHITIQNKENATIQNKENAISELITVHQRTFRKRVVEIDRVDKSSLETTNTHITLTYDTKGHLTQAIDDEFTYTYQWNDDQTLSIQVKRNRNGQVMKCTAILDNSRLVEFRGIKGIVDYFTYDSDGHLTTINNDISYTQLDWEGDLLKTVTLDSFSTFFHKEWTLTYDSRMSSRDLTYFYYDFFAGPLDMFLTGTIHYLVIAHRDLLGKFTPYAVKHVSAYEEYDYGSFTSGFSSGYDYTYDRTEYPTHIVEDWDDNTCWEQVSFDITWN